MLDFPGEANRVRCLAHIVNLVVKMILRQFDVPKKKKKKDVAANDPNVPNLAPSLDEDDPEMMEDEIDKLVRVLDKEEKEMDEADEESDKLVRDLELIEEAMEEEIEGVSKLAKPVCDVLFKVGTLALWFK
jgi:hypothetical protein